MELSDKFETVIDRSEFMSIPSEEDAKTFLAAWVDVLLKEKRRQMNHGFTGLTKLPWSVNNVWNMPMVIWLRKGE